MTRDHDAQLPREPTLAESLVPVGCLILMLAASVINVDDLPQLGVITTGLELLARLPLVGPLLHASIPVQIPLVMATMVAALMAWRLGMRWPAIHTSFLNGIRLSLGAVLILLVVGMLIGVWIASGVVPLMIAWGLELLSPQAFLVATCLLCAVVSLASGSSWTTAGTVGVALIGVGQGLGIPLPMVAGAIISGAYFGDKMSPLSDTTNLAPGVAGADLFEHVRHMVWTTGPSFLIALTLYGLIGLRYGGEAVEPESLLTMGQALASGFDLSGWLLLPPLLVLGLVLMRVAALPSLILGMLAGVVAGMLQGVSLADLLTIAFDGFNAQTGVAEVDDLLSRGGMVNMSGPIMIILCAMCFGGVMEQSRMLEVIANAILERAKSRGGVVVATLGTCLGINVTTADQYLSIVVPARMYRPAFARHGLHAKNLSRCLEDGGTITSPLIPWNSCGAYMFATLGVFPFAYLPFAFLNLLNPILSAIYGFTGWTMTLAEKSDED